MERRLQGSDTGGHFLNRLEGALLGLCSLDSVVRLMSRAPRWEKATSSLSFLGSMCTPRGYFSVWFHSWSWART